MPYRLSASFRSLQHKLMSIQHRELSTPRPSRPSSLVFFSLSRGISWGYIYLEVKTVCTLSGLHALLIFLLMPLMYSRNTLALSRPLGIHLTTSSTSSHLLASGTHLPWEPSGHAFFHLPVQIPIGISVLLRDGDCVSKRSWSERITPRLSGFNVVQNPYSNTEIVRMPCNSWTV